MNSLTILTVNYQSSEFLAANIELTRVLNPASNVHWHIVENSPSESHGGLEKLRLLEDAKTSVSIVPGVPFDQKRYPTGSHHHAAGLNAGLAGLKGGQVLVLDPDFYVLVDNWITKARNYIVQRDLTFLGAPWNPQWFRKPRYFPSVHCLFIDFDKIGKDSIDFSPGPQLKSARVDSESGSAEIGRPDFLRRLAQGLLLRKRLLTSQDTGWMLYEKFFEDASHKWEAFLPLFDPRKNYPAQYFKKLHLFLDAVLPERFSLIPKKASSYLTLPVESLPSCTDKRELFYFLGELWGLHFRCQRADDADNIEKKVRQVLASSLGRTMVGSDNLC